MRLLDFDHEAILLRGFSRSLKFGLLRSQLPKFSHFQPIVACLVIFSRRCEFDAAGGAALGILYGEDLFGHARLFRKIS